MKTNREGSRRRDQRAVAWLHGLPVGPISLSTTPRSTTQPRVRHERIILRRRGPFRWDLGSGAPLLLPSSLLRKRSASFANIPTEAHFSMSSRSLTPSAMHNHAALQTPALTAAGM